MWAFKKMVVVTVELEPVIADPHEATVQTAINGCQREVDMFSTVNSLYAQLEFPYHLCHHLS
ncbi:hypothetical protein HanRHA438_Chr16g0751581 [Helianthus annuus]|nr:hypothetical protein HanRHA438_Chr16g0751581 [Helianthus annuus]